MDAGGNMKIGAIWHFEIERDGAVVDSWDIKNLVPNAALDNVLDTYLRNGTPNANWYVAIIENDYTPTSGLTGANFAASLTECTSYTTSASNVAPFALTSRAPLTLSAASGQAVTNSAVPAAFSMTATKTIYAGAIVNAATGTPTMVFSAVNTKAGGVGKALTSGDLLKVTVTVSAATA